MLNLRTKETVTFEVDANTQIRFGASTITPQLRAKKYRMIEAVRQSFLDRGVLDDDGKFIDDIDLYLWRDVQNVAEILSCVEFGQIKNGNGEWVDLDIPMDDAVAFHEAVPDALIDALSVVVAKHNSARFAPVSEEKKEPIKSE